MKKDLSKVLDVSSFRINNLGTSAESQNYKNLPSNVLDTCLPTERNSPHECVTPSLCGSAGDLYQSCSGRRSKGLAFKTPLQEISENLIDSLHPANTFNGRNYFSEVKEQIVKVFKQCSANQMIEKQGIHSALHKRLHKRKTGEPAMKPDSTKRLSPHFPNNTSLTEEPKMNENVNPRDMKQDEDYKQYKPKKPLENPSCNVELFKQINVTTNQMINQTCDRRENLSCKNVEPFDSSRGEKQSQDRTYSKLASTFDILDFLDHTIQKTTNQNTKYFTEQNDKELECLVPPLNTSLMKNTTSSSMFYNTIKKQTENSTFFPHQKDEDRELFEKYFPEVSPLKKPSLKTPTPPRFYRRKMF
ncbi:uncharacterized protein LOC116306401 isoform X2 [Actinia tenebrosa]|nr:uncharacterized protein LOC116306401 isoform X2 [Actinia tenebrosa]